MYKERLKKFNRLKQILRPIIFLMVFCILFSTANIIYASNFSSKLEGLYNRQGNIKEDIKNKSGQADEKEKQAKDLSITIDTLKSNISETESKINSLDNQITQTEQEINDTGKEITQREEELIKENINKNNTLREIYETGRLSTWELLISVKNLSEAINHSHYFETLESRVESTIKKVTELKKNLEDKKSELDKKKAELSQLKGEQQAYRQSLDLQKKEKTVILDDTESQQRALEEQIAEASKLKKQVEAQIASIQAEIRRSQRSGKGVLPRDRGTSPVGFSWPANYKYISCYYGESTPFQSFHTGIDLVNIPGTPIYAASSGTVVTVRDMMTGGHYYGYGKYVVIGHNAKYSSLYAHLMSYIVSPGQEVQKGDIIGYLGNTGWSTGPHLHFEIWDNGNRANPIQYLP